MASRQQWAREEVSKQHAIFEQLVRDCDDGLIRKSELQKFVADAREKLKACLDPDTRPYRVFDRMQEEIGSYWVNDNRSPYAERPDCEYAGKWLNLLAAVLREVDPSASAAAFADQYTLREGDAYGSIRTILRVMKGATKELAIVDPYLDSTVFDYVDEVDNQVILQLLTGGKPKPVFITLLGELRKQWPAAVEARSSDKFHDRFLVLDTTEIWQLGCSLNGVGHATSMFNRAIDPAAKAKLFDEFSSAWNTGKVI